MSAAAAIDVTALKLPDNVSLSIAVDTRYMKAIRLKVQDYSLPVPVVVTTQLSFEELESAAGGGHALVQQALDAMIADARSGTGV